MCRLFDEHAKEIKKYCDDNGLDFDIVKSMPQCWGRNDIWLQYHDPEKGKNGLLDETPAPIVLKIQVENGGVRVEQTEHTEKYLKKVS